MRTIGLIGGLAFRAGVFYYEQIVRRCALDGRVPRVLLNHADVGAVLSFVGSGDKAGLGAYLGGLANGLFAGGADLVAVTAVAPHMAIEEFSRAARGPVVNVLDSVAGGIDAAGLGRVAVFGNRAVMETDLFGTVGAERAVRLAPPQLEAVHATYNDIALHGKRGTRPEVALLNGVARGLIDEGGAQAVLLAGTDLSSFYAETKPDYPSLDVARLHIDEIMRRATSP